MPTIKKNSAAVDRTAAARRRRGSEFSSLPLSLWGAEEGKSKEPLRPCVGGQGEQQTQPSLATHTNVRRRPHTTRVLPHSTSSRAYASLRAAPAAFVTFKSRRTAVLAATALLHHDVSAWNATAAPGPEEVIWGSLSLRAWERAVRGVVGWGGLIACAGAFLVPVVLIQSVLEIPRLRAIGAPWVEAVLTFPVVQSVTQCILPPFFLNLALYPAPWVIASLTRLAGPPSLFAVDVSVVQKHFAFLVIAVFFGSFVSGAVLNQLTMWTRHPAQAARILGTAIPLTSLFFLNFVEFCALAAAPFALLRAFGLAAFALKSRAASTERAKARLWQDQFADYGRTLPRHGLVALIGIVFAPITPLVPPMCLLYFVVASITEKYNLL